MTPTTHSPIHPRLRTLLSRVIAGAATAVVVAVPPIALWALVGNPLPEDLPGWSGVQAALTEGQLAERTLFKVLALICWIAWFELIVALALELVGTFRADDRPPVPVLGVFRSLAVVLVAGLSLSSSSDAAGADDTDLPPLPRMPETPASVDPDEQRGPEPDQDERSATTPRVATRAGASPRTPEAHTHVVDDYMVDEEHVVDEYVVEQRDSLWAIADRELGDPHRWIEILELNREREQPGGGRLQDPGDLIHPGWVLTLPTHPTAGPSDESVVVRDGDTLWGIAETHLGTGARWPEIAAENTDRINDPDLILPDWNLDLPASTGAPEDRDPLAAARHADESAQAVDAEAEAALDRLREATKDRESAPGNGAGAPPDHHAPLTSLPPAEPVTPDPSHDAKPDPDAKAEPAADPESVSPVEVNDSETEAKSPEDTDADPLPVVPPAPSDEGPATDRTLRLPASETWPDRRGSDEDPEHERPEREEAEREEIELDTGDDLIDIASVEVRPTSLTRSLTGAGIFAAGVAWTLTRLRRARERRRESGDPVVACEHPGTEISIRQAAEAELMTFLDEALKRLAEGLRAESRVCPPIVGVNVADELSVLFGAPDPAPVAGYTMEDDGFSWMIAQRDPLPDLIDGGTTENPLPALFTLGHTERSQVLLNPETANSISVRGSTLELQEALFTMAVELATGPWAGRLRVLCVGFAHELSALDNVDVVESLQAVRTDLEHRAAAASERLSIHNLASDVDGRITAGNPPGTWDPIVVLCAPTIDDDAIDELLTIAHRTDRAGVTAIVAGEHDTTWRIEVRGEQVELAPMGVRLSRHRLGEQHRSALGSLLSHAARVRALTPPSPPRTGRVAQKGSDAGLEELPHVADDPAVEVKILGPVTIDGRAAEFNRRKALELVVYLALHRDGVETDVLMEALWPDRFAAPGTLHTVASLARRCVGVDASGTPYLPHVGADGIYRVSSTLSLDYDRFRAYTDRAGRRDQAGAIEDLRAALSLVRGRPFSSTGIEYLWTHAEALTSAIVAEITDAAHELACLYLDASDHRGVWWATQQGLAASPGNEQLHRDRMFAADLAGNPAGVEEIMEELCGAIEIDGDERDDVLHPLTLEIYEQLTRRHRSRTFA